eukprot:765951-Hanusia_phi.AAC.3
MLVHPRYDHFTHSRTCTGMASTIKRKAKERGGGRRGGEEMQEDEGEIATSSQDFANREEPSVNEEGGSVQRGSDDDQLGGQIQLFAPLTRPKKDKIAADKQHHHKTESVSSRSFKPEQPEGKNLSACADAGGAKKSIVMSESEERDFSSLGIENWLVSACNAVGLRRPTDVQWNCIPAALAGRNILASAETGSGKTAAFALPIIQQLSKDPYGVFAVVLTPTRELAFQIQDQFVALGSRIQLRNSVVVGGLDMMKQAVELCKRPHVVIATPGRLSDHISSSPGVKSALARTRVVVLDEADRLLEDCFEAELANILDALPKNRSTYLFSATITASIEELKHLGAMKNCFEYEADNPKTTVRTVRELYLHMPKMVKDVYLSHVVRNSEAKAMIIFVGRKTTCVFVQLLLEDVASRGLDIPKVDLVINYDIPNDAKDYIHRVNIATDLLLPLFLSPIHLPLHSILPGNQVGRTARAGRTGTAVSLVTQYDVGLVHNIEAETGKKLEDFGLKEEVVLESMSEVGALAQDAADS